MNVDVYRQYKGAWQLVGTFAPQENAWEFLYDPDYYESPNAHPLSHSLPLQAQAYSRSEYQGFFEGLLPESTMRTELARGFHLNPSDFVGLLSHIGLECVGSLKFQTTEAETVSPHYEVFSEADLQELLDAPAQLSTEIIQATRLSLAGAQNKFGIYADPAQDSSQPENWLKPLGTAPSTHIIKVASERFPTLPYIEWACMELARACGLPIANLVVPNKFPRILVVQRFDRTDATMQIDEHKAPTRLHQEDFCQALGWAPYLKYEVAEVLYARLAGKLIQHISANPVADAYYFAQRVFFDYLVGNCDGHLKNYSFLYSPDWLEKRLSPVYDVVSTTLLGFDRKMAFTIGEHIVIDEISKEDWNIFAHDIGLPEKEMQEIQEKFLADMAGASEQAAKQLPAPGQEQLERIMDDMQQRFFAVCKNGGV